MAGTGASHRIAHALPRATGRPRRTESMGSRASSAEKFLTVTTPTAMNLRDSTVSPKDGVAQHASHYDMRSSHDAPAHSPGRETSPEATASKGAQTTSPTSSYTARRGRPRKTTPPSAEQPAAKVISIDIESEDEASKPVDVAVSGSSTHDKGKALVDHSSDSTDFAEVDAPPVVKRGRPRGRPRKTDPHSTEKPAAKVTRVDVENEDEASEDVASKSVEVDAPPVVKRARPRGRPRKTDPHSTEKPATKVTRIDIESEDKASKPVAVAGSRARAHYKGKALVDHPSNSTDFSEVDEPVVKQSHLRGRPPKNARVSDPKSEVAPSKSAATQLSEESSDEEDTRPLKTTPAKWRTDNVYVEVFVDGRGSDSDSSGSRDSDSGSDSDGSRGSGGDRSADESLASSFIDTPLNAATHTSSDSVAYSAGAIVDSNPFLTASQAHHSDDEVPDDDDRFINDDIFANNQPLAGLGSVADLTVLDYLSQRVIDEVNTLVQVLDDNLNMASAPNTTFRRLDCYAHEQVLIRKHHFTRDVFLSSNNRPADEDDIVQWASSLQRINMATFLLLVLRPLIAVAKPVSSSLPNRERTISSMGLMAASQGFFANVVPGNLRSVETVDLLVDLLTQQILAAANDEEHLQTLVSDARNIDDDAIAKLLAIEDCDASDDVDRRVTSYFDFYAVPYYRNELGQRLNRITGGKLHITRSQYSLRALWKKLMSFCSQCASNWRVPIILGDVGGKQTDTSFNILDDADEPNEREDDVGGNERDIVLAAELEAEHQATDDPTAVEETESVTDARTAKVAPIDPSFREERRVASIMRDTHADPYLDELVEAIDPEHIDISDSQVQSRTPQRILPAHRHVFAQVPSHPSDNGGHNNGDASDNVSEFRLDVEEEAEASVPVSPKEQAASGRSISAEVPRRVDNSQVDSDNGSEFRLDGEDEDEGALSASSSFSDQAVAGYGKPDKQPRRVGKRRVYSDHSSESDQGGEKARMARDIVRAIRKPIKRSRQSNDLRGRRGIAAEDLDLLADNRDRIEFTPSAGNSPANNDRRVNASVNGRETHSAAYESLGQYRPLKLVRSKPTQAANVGGSSSRGNRDHHSDRSDQSDADFGTTGHGRREKPIQHRVRWTEAEEECLVRALSEFGPQWVLILQYYGEGGTRSRILRHRTGRHLKDKARNIKRRLIRDNMPLGPLERVTG